MENLIEIVVMNDTLTEEEKVKVRRYINHLKLDVLISELEETWASQEN